MIDLSSCHIRIYQVIYGLFNMEITKLPNLNGMEAKLLHFATIGFARSYMVFKMEITKLPTGTAGRQNSFILPQSDSPSHIWS